MTIFPIGTLQKRSNLLSWLAKSVVYSLSRTVRATKCFRTKTKWRKSSTTKCLSNCIRWGTSIWTRSFRFWTTLSMNKKMTKRKILMLRVLSLRIRTRVSLARFKASLNKVLQTSKRAHIKTNTSRNLRAILVQFSTRSRAQTTRWASLALASVLTTSC